MCYRILNQIKGIENQSYLELGIGNGKNFELVRCARKMSVDINGRAMFTGTTDDFFYNSTTELWDLIYIDACHDFEFVLRDFNNSVLRCREWVLIHDMIPPSKKYCSSRLCSDGFRLLFYLWKETLFQLYPMQGNYGLTFVRMPARAVDLPDWYRRVDYEQFMQFIDGLHLYTEGEIVEVLNG